MTIPFFVKGLALGDVVQCERAAEGWLRFTGLVARSGFSVFRIWLPHEGSTEREAILSELHRLGCTTEVTLDRLVAISVPPASEERAWRFLQEGFRCGRWDLAVGYSPD
jgi:hypothetical protein